MHFKDFVTLCNALFGLLALNSIVSGNLLFGLVFIACAMIVDFLDGRIARKVNASNEFGKELDSLADAISFGFVPAFSLAFLFSGILSLAVAGLYLACGLVRLAKFNLQKEKGVFFGLPIPVAAFVSMLSIYFNFLPALVLSLCGIAMVLKFKIRKF